MILLLCMLVAVPAAHAAAPGGLTPLAGTGSCFDSDPAGDGFPACSPFSSAVQTPGSGVVSPDGENLYVAGRGGGGGILVYDRDPATGLLSPLPGTSACVAGDGDPGCGLAIGLGTVWTIAVSPNGNHVYAASTSPSSVTVFNRNSTTGALTQLVPASDGCITDVPVAGCSLGRTLLDVTALAVSPDNKHVYAGGEEGITVLQATGTGGLVQPAGADGCVDNDGAVGNVCADGLAMPDDDIMWLDVTPNGAAVLATTGGRAAEFFGGGTTLMSLIRSSISGALTPRSGGGGGCASKTGAEGCISAPDLEGTRAVVVAPGGSHAYVASQISDTIVGVDLDVSGAITGAPFTCLSDAVRAGCTAAGHLDGPLDIAISPDGRQLYAAVYNSAQLRAINRNPVTGQLSPVPVNGCVNHPTNPAPCPSTGPGFKAIEGVAVSRPDGGTVYGFSTPVLGGPNVVAGYRRDLAAPSCTSTAASTPHATAIDLALPCSDSDHDPVTIAIVTPPAQGTLSSVDQSAKTVRYEPPAGFTGTATFTYRATAAGIDSAPATYTVTVAPDQDPPGLTLAGKKKQKLSKAVAVTASCDEICSIAASGKLSVKPPKGARGSKPKTFKLKRAKAQAAAGAQQALKLKLPKRARKAAGAALAKGGKVKAALEVSAKDAAGNVASGGRSVKLKPL